MDGPLGDIDHRIAASTGDDRFIAARLIARQNLPVAGCCPVSDFPGEQVMITTASSLLLGDADNAARSRIGQGVAALYVLGDDAIVQCIGYCLEQLHGTLMLATNRHFHLMTVVDALDQPSNQEVEQQCRDGDEQPALQHADQDNGVRILDHQPDRFVRQHDPQRSDNGVSQYDADNGPLPPWLNPHGQGLSRKRSAMALKSSNSATNASTMSGSKCLPRSDTMMSWASSIATGRL